MHKVFRAQNVPSTVAELTEYSIVDKIYFVSADMRAVSDAKVVISDKIGTTTYRVIVPKEGNEKGLRPAIWSYTSGIKRDDEKSGGIKIGDNAVIKVSNIPLGAWGVSEQIYDGDVVLIGRGGVTVSYNNKGKLIFRLSDYTSTSVAEKCSMIITGQLYYYQVPDSGWADTLPSSLGIDHLVGSGQILPRPATPGTGDITYKVPWLNHNVYLEADNLDWHLLNCAGTLLLDPITNTCSWPDYNNPNFPPEIWT